jgi:hypothetical protein
MIADKCRRFNGPPMAYLSQDLMEVIHGAFEYNPDIDLLINF